MREKILTYIERNSRVDLKDLAIMLGTDEAAVTFSELVLSQSISV